MLIWQGRGILLVPFAILASLAGYWIAEDIGTGVALIVGAVPTWLVGRRWNSEPERVLVDQATGDQVVFRKRHSLFFLPMQWWAVPLVVMGISFMFGG